MEVIVDTTKGVYRERIVRCRECKYFIDNLTEDDTDEAYDSCRWDWSRKIPTADDFCSYGSRSEKPNSCKDEPQTDYDKGLQLFADILFDKEKSEQFLKECKAMGIEPQTERID